MSLELLDARESAGGVAITFATERGIERLEGSCAEVERLATVMRQVAALAPLHEGGRVWLDRVVVGDAVVHLGLKPDGEARVRIVHARPNS
ncbi:MAG: hypothetical protein ACRDLV_11420 [Solirubrobacteraceae bacterium]